MYDFNSEVNLIIQGCIAVIIIGVFYNLMSSTKAYGGIVGKAVRLFGIGVMFVSLTAIERALTNFDIIRLTYNISMLQDVMTVVALIFLGLGFSKLAAGAKS